MPEVDYISEGLQSPDIWQTQLEILNNLAGDTEDKVSEIIRRFRLQPWANGEIDDIKRGSFIVEGRERGPLAEELFSHTNQVDYPGQVYAWEFGLENNIALDLNGLPAVVVDKHNFALGFILDAYMRGMIPVGSKMITFDEHDDARSRDKDIAPSSFVRMHPEEQVAAIINNTHIGNWIGGELLRLGIIDSEKFKRFRLKKDETGDDNLTLFKVWGETPKLCNSECEFEIVDVDIDVLLPIDEKLSSRDKAAVLRGEIPLEIENFLLEIATVASKAKLLTVATSPLFINQDRAIIYVKKFLEIVKSLRLASSKASI